MKSEEKQIKLLTKRISKIQNKGVKDIPNFTNIFIDNQELAEELLKHYQPKLPKGSVVLSGKQCAEIVQDNYNIGYERGSKEMAEKIINPLLDVEVIDEDYKQFFLDVCGKLEELADKHGVEIKGRSMTVCEHCQYRNSWDCQDDYYKSKNGCESFKLDFDILTKKQQKAIRRILVHEEELLGE